MLVILALALHSVTTLNFQAFAFLGLTALAIAIGIASEPLMLGLQLEQRANYFVAINVGASTTGGLFGCFTALIREMGMTSWAAAQLITSLLSVSLFPSLTLGLALSKAPASRAEYRALLNTWYPLVPGAGALCGRPRNHPLFTVANRGC